MVQNKKKKQNTYIFVYGSHLCQNVLLVKLTTENHTSDTLLHTQYLLMGPKVTNNISNI